MWIVVTDLDGTLLNHDDYSWEGARDALAVLETRGIPVVLCTSKTRAEVEAIRRELGTVHPFIVENGAAVFLPEESYGRLCPHGVRRDGYVLLELGSPYGDLVAALRESARESGCAVRGFADASVAEVAEWCGFSEEQARLARRREYDEPFILESGTPESLLKAIESRGFSWTRGGRFFHILGQSDKGKAVRELRAVFGTAGAIPQIAALGDSPNDLAMLKEADCPIVIPSARLKEMQAALPFASIAPSPGSAGWGAAILHHLPGWLHAGRGSYPFR